MRVHLNVFVCAALLLLVAASTSALAIGDTASAAFPRRLTSVFVGEDPGKGKDYPKAAWGKFAAAAKAKQPPLAKAEVVEAAGWVAALTKIEKEGKKGRLAKARTKRNPKQLTSSPFVRHMHPQPAQSTAVRFREILRQRSSVRNTPDLIVLSLNVGNADSTFIKYGNINILVDAGRSQVASRLKTLGIRKLDHLVLTHAHADHIRGVRKLFDGDDKMTEIHGATIGTTSHARRTRYNPLRAKLGASCVQLPSGWTHVLTATGLGHDFVMRIHSAPNVDASEANENLHSLAVEIYSNGRWVVLTGDAETPLQNKWAGYQWLTDIRLFGIVDFFKAAHHGSRNGRSEVWEGVECSNAMIPTDGARYGHPHDEALQWLSPGGGLNCEQVYRSDLQGHVLFRFKAGQLQDVAPLTGFNIGDSPGDVHLARGEVEEPDEE